MKDKVSPFIRASILWRSLWVQASWSPKYMQSLGILYMLEPALEKKYPSKEERARELGKRLGFFNTNPYLSPMVGGCMAAEELSGEDSKVLESRNMLMGFLGGVGDKLFWGSIRPMLILFAVAGVLSGYWYAPLIFVAVFLCSTLTLRLKALNLGADHGRNSAKLLAESGTFQWAERFKSVGAALLGFVLCGMMIRSFGLDISASILICFIGFVLSFFFNSLIGRRADPVWIVVVLTVICVGFGAIR